MCLVVGEVITQVSMDKKQVELGTLKIILVKIINNNDCDKKVK